MKTGPAGADPVGFNRDGRRDSGAAEEHLAIGIDQFNTIEVGGEEVHVDGGDGLSHEAFLRLEHGQWLARAIGGDDAKLTVCHVCIQIEAQNEGGAGSLVDCDPDHARFRWSNSGSTAGSWDC